MDAVRIYHRKEINTLDELVELMSSGVPACFDPPKTGTCVCAECFEYEITIEKIKRKNMTPR